MKHNIKISFFAAVLSIAVFTTAINTYYKNNKHPRKSPEPKYPKDQSIQLTEAEQIWLNNHPNIIFQYTDSFEPLVIKNKKGDISGIMVDVLNIFNYRLNTNFTLKIDKWPNILIKAKNKKVDAILLIKSSLADQLGLLKTEIASSDYPTFFIKRNSPFSINKLDDIKGKKIAVIKSVAYAQEILAPYITSIKLIECTSAKMLMELVSDGSADIALSLTSQIFTIAKHRYTKIDPTYTLWNYPVDGVIGVRADWPELVSILNKALASLSTDERNAIYSKWGVLQYKKSFNYALLWKIIYGILAVILFVCWSNIRLRKAIKSKTKELISTELKYRALFEAANDAIFILRNDEIILCNQKTAHLFGFKKTNDLIGLTINDISPKLQPDGQKSSEKAKEKIAHVKEGRPQRFEWLHIKPNGDFFDGDVNLSPISIDDKTCLLAIVRDITERKKAKTELIEAKEKAEESDRLKTAFLAGISHEIHTPMNGILGFTELLKSPEIPISEKHEFIELIELSSKRMLNLIDDLINISKIEAGDISLEKNKTCINNIIDEVHSFFMPHANKKKIILKSHKQLQDDKTILLIDKNKITQVLINLISNAIKFTEEGFVEFGYNKKGSVLEFYIKDTGIGVAPSMHNIIFERFRQVDIKDSNKTEGSGLGLSISKAYVEKHGGKIWIDSDLNNGAAFYFTLPYININNKL